MKTVADAIGQRHRVGIRVGAAGIGAKISSSLLKFFLANCAHIARARRNKGKQRSIICAIASREENSMPRRARVA
jgi:hypothetical protein